MIIGLMGYAQSGKDEVAKILVEKYGFERRAFADKIRNMLYEMNPMAGGEPIQVRVDSDGWDKAKQHPEVRRLLQTMGVSARNHLGDMIWIKQAFSDMSMDKDYVITDVRFGNEARMLKYLNGELWRIERPGVGPVNNHVSELELQQLSADRTLLNGGTLDELEHLVKIRLDSALANKDN